MADKMIGELPQVPQVADNSLLAVEQGGIAYKLTGAQFKEFAKEAAKGEADRAKTEANRAKTEADRAKTEADKAAAAADQTERDVAITNTHANYAKNEADRAKDEADRAEEEADKVEGYLASASTAMQPSVYDPQGKSTDIFKYVDDHVPEGAMLSSVYDPQGKETDIFKYVDEHVPENLVTITSSGEIILSPALLAKVGDGPYTIEFTEATDDDDDDSGGNNNGEDDNEMAIKPNILVNGTPPYGNTLVSSGYNAQNYPYVINGWIVETSGSTTTINNVEFFNDTSAIGTHQYIGLYNDTGSTLSYTQYIPMMLFNVWVDHILSIVYSISNIDGVQKNAGYITFGGISNTGTRIELYKENLGTSQYANTQDDKFSLSHMLSINDVAFTSSKLFFIEITLVSGIAMNIFGIKLEEGTTQTLTANLDDTMQNVYYSHDISSELLRSQQYSYAIRANSGDLGSTPQFTGYANFTHGMVDLNLQLPTKMLCKPKAYVTKSPMELGVYFGDNFVKCTVAGAVVRSYDLQNLNVTFYVTKQSGYTYQDGPCMLLFYSGELLLSANLKESLISA